MRFALEAWRVLLGNTNAWTSVLRKLECDPGDEADDEYLAEGGTDDREGPTGADAEVHDGMMMCDDETLEGMDRYVEMHWEVGGLTKLPND